MADNGCGRVGCATVFGLFFGLPLAILVASPAIAAHIVVSGSPNLMPYLQEWQWPALGSPLLALVLVRFALAGDGRLRRKPPAKRWLGMLARAALLLGVVNGIAFFELSRQTGTDFVIKDGLPTFALTGLAGLVMLIAIRVRDRRGEPPTVEEVRAAAREADRALSRVRTENERVRRQADQVQARVAKLRARGSGPTSRTTGQADAPHTDGFDLDFRSLRTFHRESYQCADTAHVAYQSAQASLHTMSQVVRRTRLAPQQWMSVGRKAKQVRAEMRAAVSQLARSQSELRVQVDQGLDMVRTLNANTSDLKHEIRDSCGEPGRHWFEALEQRIAEAREERRRSRIG